MSDIDMEKNRFNTNLKCGQNVGTFYFEIWFFEEFLSSAQNYKLCEKVSMQKV